MDVVAQLEQILQTNSKVRLGRNGLADDLNLSRFQLYRRVKANAGVSPKKLAGRHRIDQACRLLKETDKDVRLIAAEVGVDDANYFARFFKRQTGYTPSAWRKWFGRSASEPSAPEYPSRIGKRSGDEAVLPVHLL